MRHRSNDSDNSICRNGNNSNEIVYLFLFLLLILFYKKCCDHQVVQQEEALCVEALNLGWGLVQGLATNPHDFWLALKGFVSMAFQHKLLQLSDSQAPTLVSTLKQVIQNALSLIR